MPSYLTTTLDRHNREVDGFYEMAGSVKGTAGDMFNRTSRNSALSLLSGTDNKYAEQYSHYKSWPYVAIRAISHRVAGQQVLMARRAAGSAQARARFIMSQKGMDMRTMKSWESERLPAWLKGHMGFEGELITSHELLDAIRRPNQMMTHWSLMVCTVASIELTGRSFWYISRDEGDGIQIWPLPTDWVTPIQGDGVFKEYVVTPGSGNTSYTLSSDQVAYFSLPDPANPMGSFSPVQAQIRAIETDEAIQQAQDVTFKRGIFPGMVLMTGRLPGVGGQPGVRPVLTADQRKQLYNAVFSAYEGVSHFGEPLIVDGMIEGVEKFTTTPQEMDFQASGKVTKSRILQAFGVNPIILGEVENANRAQAAVAEENFCNNVVNPLLELMSQVMTAYLGPIVEDGGDVAIWIDPTHPHDREQRLKEWTEAAKIGAVSVNEFRTKMLNLPPMEGGDIALRPLNFESVDVSTGGTVQAGHSRGSPPSPKAARAKMPATQSDASKLTLQDVFNLHLKQLDKAQRRFSKLVEKLFRKMYLSAADKLDEDRHTLHENLAEELFDPDEWLDELHQTVGEAWMQAAIEGAMAELALYDSVVRKKFEFEPTDEVLIDVPPNVLAGVSSELDDVFKQPYWRDILSTTSLDMQQVITSGITQGHSIGQVERAIRDSLVGGRHPAIRANAMARTEMGAAINAGHQQSMKELQKEGLVSGKQWLSVCGNTTRADHCNINMQEVSVDALFLLGDEETPYPSHHMLTAGNRINCQCTHISVNLASNLAPGEQLVIPETTLPPSGQGGGLLPVNNLSANLDITLAGHLDDFGRVVNTPEIEKLFEVRTAKLFGKKATKEEVATLCGAPDGSTVYLNVKSSAAGRSDDIWVQIENAKLGYESSRRIYQQPVAGSGGYEFETVMSNQYLRINASGRGVGSRTLSRQADAAHRMGINELECTAAKSRDYNGYYTWARLGYDSELSALRQPMVIQSRIEAFGPKSIQGATKVSDIMATPEGRAFWKEYGEEWSATFDTAPGSKGRRVLADYIEEKSDAWAAVAAKGFTKAPKGKQEEHEMFTDEDEAILDRIWARHSAV
jgi:HK97 family phage portal protein